MALLSLSLLTAGGCRETSSPTSSPPVSPPAADTTVPSPSENGKPAESAATDSTDPTALPAKPVSANRPAGDEDCECASLEDLATEATGAEDDPTRDGWTTEVLGNQVSSQLKHFGEFLTAPTPPQESELASLVTSDFQATSLRPADRRLQFEDDQFQVYRFSPATKSPEGSHGESITPQSEPNSFLPSAGTAALSQGIRELRGMVEGCRDVRHKFKVIRIARDQEKSGETSILLELGGRNDQGARQQHAEWKCRWSYDQLDQPPRLTRLELVHYEEVALKSKLGTLFRECTPSLMRNVPAYQRQYFYDSQYWTNHVERRLGSDLLGFHGMAVGDVNQDGLDDVYICAPGGLPDRLLLQQEDGSLRDHSAESRVNFYDCSRSVIMVDLDNDSDQDLALATVTGLLFLENNGEAVFTPRQRITSAAKAYTLAAADYDRDGFVDVYACRYHPPASDPFGNPMPYHDANNGSPNVLVRNDGDWKFQEVTQEVGLDENNRRWSYAAAWEDYDNDGDMDLYVANDFGRNNLYRNDNGHFHDVAAEAGVEDIASGMSVGWGDFDRDGWMDLYVSNMFSAAGGRVAFQRSFKSEAAEETRGYLQRLARGNTLFRNRGDGTFEDITMSAGVNMARWAWSAPFCDWNNDGWSDLVVTNGHFTGADLHDL